MARVPDASISLADLNNVFAGGNSLSGYYNKRWFQDNNARGYIQASGQISLSDFAGKRDVSPVSPGSATYYSSRSIPIPMFNNLTVTVVSGQGGQGGISGDCASGGFGGAGQDSYVSGYVGSAQGPAGSPSGNWGSQASASTSLSINDSNQSSIISRYGTTPYGQVGAGGGGGSTGYNNRTVTVCYSSGYNGVAWVCLGAYAYTVCDDARGGGGGGAPGYIQLSWN